MSFVCFLVLYCIVVIFQYNDIVWNVIHPAFWIMNFILSVSQ